MSELPDYISLSMEPALGALIDGTPIKGADFDSSQLFATLDEAGEFENSSHSPLNIVAAAYRNALHPRLAIATAKIDPETGATIQREIVIPVFEAFEIMPNLHSLDLDTDRINSSLAHELKHVADFDNPQLMMEQRCFVQNCAKKIKQERWKMRGYESLVALIGLYALSRGIIDENLFDLVAGGATTGAPLWMHRVSNRYLRNVVRAQNDLIRSKSPLEIRAYNFQTRIRQEDRIPNIIKFASQPTL